MVTRLFLVAQPPFDLRTMLSQSVVEKILVPTNSDSLCDNSRPA